ncbi:MAG: thioesterase family protein [Pseudomonadota bacterium]
MEYLRRLYSDQLSFNQLLGFRIDAVSPTAVSVNFPMRPELIGNPVHQTLHGGVISSVLDVTGGLMASTGVVDRMAGAPIDTIARRLAGVGTIDLRVDYLRPGRGKHFTATGAVMRAGNKVTVTRMELHNDDGVLIAVGTGTYMVG